MSNVTAPNVPGEKRGEAEPLHSSWLEGFRWVALGGQALLIVWMTVGLSLHVESGLLIGLLSLSALSNVALAIIRRRRVLGSAALSLVMAFDIAHLTALLALTGGPFNPFSTLYLVNVVLGVMVLPRAHAWGLMALSLISFATLFFTQSLDAALGIQAPTHQEMMQLHLEGMLVAFAVAASVITYFTQRLQKALHQREQQLQQARSLAEQHEKLAALTTLAAGAAHELATPLSTIALASRELELALAAASVNAEAVADVKLIREQVERCRAILAGMSTQAGELQGETFQAVKVREWQHQALEGISRSERVTLQQAQGVADIEIVGPPRALGFALRNLIRNALDASTEAVTVSSHCHDGMISVEVIDSGSGMSEQVAKRAGEPFFTTKPTGAGMGLGIFLTRTLAKELGGSLVLQSSPAGTVARLSLPVKS